MAGQGTTRKKISPVNRVKPLASKTTINVIVETPKGKRNKFRFDEKLGLFRLGKVLPADRYSPTTSGSFRGRKRKTATHSTSF